MVKPRALRSRLKQLLISTPQIVEVKVPAAIDGHAKLSFSQEGEDLFLDRILSNQEKGFYIDIGAHHPKRFSNTYIFYQRGWRGINVEASKALITEFNTERPRDINVTAAVGKKAGTETFYIFNEEALNTFDAKLVKERESSGQGYKVISKEKIKLSPLDTLLEEYMPKDVEQIDILSVDVEGKDLEVLESNNWDKYRPRFIVAESLTRGGVEDVVNDPITIFLKKKGYQLQAKLFNSIIFSEKSA